MRDVTKYCGQFQNETSGKGTVLRTTWALLFRATVAECSVGRAWGNVLGATVEEWRLSAALSASHDWGFSPRGRFSKFMRL